MAVERIVVTTAGGTRIAGPTNLGVAVAAAVSALRDGYPVWLRDRDGKTIELTRSEHDGDEQFDVATVRFGVANADPPQWQERALRAAGSQARRKAAHT